MAILAFSGPSVLAAPAQPADTVGWSWVPKHPKLPADLHPFYWLCQWIADKERDGSGHWPDGTPLAIRRGYSQLCDVMIARYEQGGAS